MCQSSAFAGNLMEFLDYRTYCGFWFGTTQHLPFHLLANPQCAIDKFG